MILTLAEYLSIHEGLVWTEESTRYVLRHVSEVEKTALAVAELQTRAAATRRIETDAKLAQMGGR